ncbi:AAA ATPase afg3, partial [Teratosphaeriaceae sp. CCFEE 6253]
MATLLQGPQNITRSSRQLVEAARLSQALARRPATLPRPLYAYARSRTYATPSQQDGKPPGKTPAGSAKGMEHLYSQQSPMSSGPPPPPGKKPEDGSPLPGYSKLTEQEEKQLNDIFALVKKGMPASMADDIDRALVRVKKEGMPQELRDTMKECVDEGMSPARAAKLWRLTTQMARHTAEQTMSEKAQESGSEAPKQQSASDPGPGTAGKGKDGKKKPDSTNPFSGATEIKFDLSNFLLSAFVAYLLYRLVMPTENSREITWQEFRNTFLDKGLVEKLVVINANRVRVYLQRESVATMYPDSPASQQGFYYYFSIGSVEAFERRVEEAQNSLSIPSSERIPISYHDETSWLNTLYAFGPTLIFIGAIYFFSRRAASGGGGGSGGIFGMGKSRAK